jgi:NADP-dependent 3-hydroxy acid dehydrogenase YdfG
VNNAGIVKYGGIETMEMEDYDRVMATNVRSVVQLTAKCVSHLIETKGAIVNVSSVCGTRSFPYMLAYCMSKATLDQFTKVRVKVPSHEPNTTQHASLRFHSSVRLWSLQAKVSESIPSSRYIRLD